jgi:class 3 adenylate cyclase
MCNPPTSGSDRGRASHKPQPKPPPDNLPEDCRTETLGVAFFDLSRISEWASSEEDSLVASFFQQFYCLAADHLKPAGATIVKFMGDAGLVVFPPESAEAAIFALCDLAAASRAAAAEFGLDTYLNVNVHVGPVLAGRFGPAGEARFDVIGKTVNIAARLGRRGVTLSAQAFRTLSADARRRFQKYAPPVTYRCRG